MNTFTKTILVASTSLLLSAPIAFAQSADGTTLAGGDNGKAAKMSETSKDGMMKKDGMKKDGAMMKSDGMKAGSMSKDGAPSGDKMDNGMAK